MRSLSFPLATLMALFLSGLQFSTDATEYIAPQRENDNFCTVALILSEQVHSRLIMYSIADQPVSDKRETVANELHSLAHRTQLNLLSHLSLLQQAGQVHSVRPLWIINAVIAEITPSALDLIKSRHPEIDRIHPLADHELHDYRHLSGGAQPTPQSDDLPWNLNDIDVPLVWNYGYKGEGIIIALIDTGVDYEHPDLADRIWINPGEDLNSNGVVDPSDWNNVDDDANGYIDDLRGWTFVMNSPEVMDLMGSGTFAAGILAGDGSSGVETGIAPEAKIMALNNYYGQEASFWEAQQYALQMGADLVTNTLSFKWHHQPSPDYAAMRHNCDMLYAAGIMQVSPAGNERSNLQNDPIPFNIVLPGICPPPWQHPDQGLWGSPSAVLTIGAYDAGHFILSQSGCGPGSWYLNDILALQPDYPYQSSWPSIYNDFPYQNGQTQGLIKPDLCAPSDVQTTNLGGGYFNAYSGTEAATVHAAGVAALLASAHPTASPQILSEAMMLACIEGGNPGKDNIWGCGRLQAFDALSQIMLDVGGHLSGLVTDSLTGIPLTGATISISSNSGESTTDSTGSYLFLGLPESIYEVTFTMPGYYLLELRDVHIQIGEITVLNAALLDTVVGIEPDQSSQLFPQQFTVLDPYPNPFNPSATIEFYLPHASTVSIDLFNLSGQQLAPILDAWFQPGSHKANIDVSHLPSGIYFLRLKTPAENVSKKLLLVK
ncbi:S8 family serine peptidase [bacterium]|nr:S8 family serine peptidase [bacterium]